MVRLDFTPDSDWLEAKRNVDLRNVSEIALMTSILPGDQRFEVSGVDFSLIGYQIPLLEFAHGLFLAVRSAASPIGFGQTHPLDLDEDFRFRREGEDVSVEADITDEIARCSLRELNAEVRRNCVALLKYLFEIHPEARESKQLYRWYNVEELAVDALFAPLAKDDS